MKVVCHCCEPASEPTPLPVSNRPSLSAIAYRIGTFSSFRSAMLTQIARHPELTGLTTRASDDYGITVMELWAAVADVLTFYQERYANEAYLRTAGFTDSVTRLAALIGYRAKPGVAARAWISFSVDEDGPIDIAAGQKVQSVPGQDETPQIFETLKEISALRALNRARIFPAPTSTNPLAAGSAGAWLDVVDGPEMAAPLGPDQKVVLFNAGSTQQVEEKKISEVASRDHRVRLTWDRPVQKSTWSTSTRAFRYRRTLRIFGHNAPGVYVFPNADPAHPTDATRIVWSLETLTNTGLVDSNQIYLDGRYEDLQVGQRILVADKSTGGKKTLVTIQEIDQALAALGNMEDTVTRLTVSATIPAVTARRTVMVYELEGDRIRFADETYATTVTGDALYLPGIARERDGELAVEIGRTVERDDFKAGTLIFPDEIEEDRTLLLLDADDEPFMATVKEPPTIEPASAADGDFCHLKVLVDSDTALALATRTAALLGNVARASHGETVTEEVLGDGDASTVFQRFTLKKSPLTYLPAASAKGTESTLELKVNGTRWKEVSELFGQAATAAAAELRQDDEGKSVVQFGDGGFGARLPTGSRNVLARYRVGSGLDGRVAADALTTLLQRPPGLAGATNPLPAEGGADPETLETSRLNAPRDVRTFGRIVSLQDFEDQVTLSGEVAKALATPVWDGLDKAIHLTVAGQEGASFSDTALKTLGNNLRSVRDPNHRLRVDQFDQIYVQLAGGVGVEADVDADEVLENARQAVIDALSFDALSLGQSVNLSDMYRVIQDVPGVRFVDIDWFFFKLTTFGGFWALLFELWRRRVTFSALGIDPVQPRLNIFTALPDPANPGLVLPAELAGVETPDEDIVLTLRAG